MKACLLGGSNSVLSHGIGKGLAVEIDCINLSLGGTSSLQNTYELIRSKEKVIDCDFIVTESNVNDSFNIFNTKIPQAIVLENIKSFYYQLLPSRYKIT